jgi:hypothetical protein
MKHYGYYSAYADSQFGHCIYLTPDGLKVKVTEITRQDKPAGKWNDFVYLGEVTECIKPKKIDWNIDPEILLQKAQAMLAQQKSCQLQFPSTGKCFCYTCSTKLNCN